MYINSVPQAAATTLSFSSVSILLLCWKVFLQCGYILENWVCCVYSYYSCSAPAELSVRRSNLQDVAGWLLWEQKSAMHASSYTLNPTHTFSSIGNYLNLTKQNINTFVYVISTIKATLLKRKLQAELNYFCEKIHWKCLECVGALQVLQNIHRNSIHSDLTYLQQPQPSLTQLSTAANSTPLMRGESQL